MTTTLDDATLIMALNVPGFKVPAIGENIDLDLTDNLMVSVFHEEGVIDVQVSDVTTGLFKSWYLSLTPQINNS